MDRFCFLFLALLHLPLAAGAMGGKPFAQKGFETNDFAGWSLKRMAHSDAADIVSHPVRDGQRAAAITLGPGEFYGDSWKNELSDPFYAPVGKELWYRVSHFVPSSFRPERGNSCVLAQWHNAVPPGKPGGSPPLAHRLKDGVFTVTVSYALVPFDRGVRAERKALYSLRLPTDRWHDFVYRVVWSKGGQGQIDAWYNGRLMARYRGPLGYSNDVAGPYFKTGVYCRQSPRSPLTAYVDEYRRGESPNEVLLPGETLEGGGRISGWQNRE